LWVRLNRDSDVGHVLELFVDRAYGSSFSGTVVDVPESNGDSAVFFAFNGAERVVALEPDLHHAGLPRNPRGNSIDAYLFIRRLVHKYDRVPIYTDGAGWYADTCRWASVEHVVYSHPLKNPMPAQRMLQYVKDRTEAFENAQKAKI